jgi:nonribosomal peptide synthetase DhbF
VDLLAILDGYPTSTDPAAVRRPHDDPRNLAELLVSVGFDEDLWGDRVLRYEDFAAFAGRDDSPLRGLGDAGIAALPAVFADNANAMHGFDTGLFDGDLLFFDATEDRRSGDAAGKPVPGVWRAHVTGTVDIHEIDCRHGDMLAAGPLTRIGPVLADRLS